MVQFHVREASEQSGVLINLLKEGGHYRTFGMFCVSLSIASFANGNRSQN